MYAVIFKARINQLDQAYHDTAKRLRELATTRYGCVDLVSVCEGNQEITISYWHRHEDILAWKQDAEHLQAQQLGQSRWYTSYTVEITRLERDYQHPS